MDESKRVVEDLEAHHKQDPGIDFDARRFQILDIYCQTAAVASLVLGIVVFGGWAFHIEILKSVFPGFATMKANTALCIALSGASLWLLLPAQPGALRKRIGYGFALLVILIAAATFAEYLSVRNFGIDQLLFRDVKSYATTSLGRMAPTTAAAFLLIGLALRMLNWQTRRGGRPAQVLSLGSGLIAMLAITGYFYHATALYRLLLYTQIALHTAIGIFLLSCSIFFARPRSGLACEIMGRTSGAAMARRFLPGLVLIPLALGWIREQGQIAGWYGPELGVALATTTNIVIFAVVVWLSARDMNREHGRRNRAEVALQHLNASLELRIIERTEASRSSEVRFLTACMITVDAFFILESVRDRVGEIVDFRFLFVNDVGSLLLCSTPENLQGSLLCERFPAGHAQPFFDAFRGVVETSAPLDREFPVDLLGVNAKWLHLRVVKLDDGVVVTSTDVTARREADLKQAETNDRFRLLVEGVKDHAFYTIDLNGIVNSWNRGAERLFGYTEADIVGHHFSCLFTPEEIAAGLPQQQLDAAMHGGQEHSEGWRVRANGECFWAEVTKTALVDQTGAVYGFAKLIQDVTERRKSAIALEQAARATDQLKLVAQDAGVRERSRLQEQFLSHVSHELRTPLTAIYFFVTNLLDGVLGELTPGQREHMQLALDNVTQLKDMVSDLLDISRVDALKLKVDSRYASATKLIKEVLSTCRTNAAEKNIQLVTAIGPDVPCVWADPTRVRQILTNLIDNAIKFTPRGGTITLRCLPYTEDPAYLCLSVSDTGCGIGPEDLEMIFDRLGQVKGSTEASRSGLGLGLFIAKTLATRHGGRLWVESRLGQGSTFSFTLRIFSLAKVCTQIFTSSNLDEGWVGLIVVEVMRLEGMAQEDLVEEMRAVLLRCIRSDKDVLLPSMYFEEPATCSFIVACTGAAGLALIEGRIRKELQILDRNSKLKLVIRSTLLPVSLDQPTGAQIGEVVAGLEQLIKPDLQAKELVH